MKATTPISVKITDIEAKIKEILAPCFKDLKCDQVRITCAEVGKFTAPGFMYSAYTWYGSARGLDFWAQALNPLGWVISGAHDLYTLTTREVRGYIQNVEFADAMQGPPLGLANTTNRTYTQVYPGALNQAAAIGGRSGGTAALPTVYANVVAHEAIWLGLLGHTDDLFAEQGTLGSNAASRSLMKLSGEQCQAVRDKLGVK